MLATLPALRLAAVVDPAAEVLEGPDGLPRRDDEATGVLALLRQAVEDRARQGAPRLSVPGGAPREPRCADHAEVWDRADLK